jgi:hypothetical protein
MSKKLVGTDEAGRGAGDAKAEFDRKAGLREGAAGEFDVRRERERLTQIFQRQAEDEAATEAEGAEAEQKVIELGRKAREQNDIEIARRIALKVAGKGPNTRAKDVEAALAIGGADYSRDVAQLWDVGLARLGKPALAVRPERSWPDAPVAPEGVEGIGKLCYPPGMLGHAVQHIIDTDKYPDRQMALWGALAACGKALDRKVIGPTDSSTVLFLLLLAATAAGKQQSLDCIRTLLRAMDSEALIQGGAVPSVQAIEDMVRTTPNCMILNDEFGRWFRMIMSQSGNVREIPAVLCKFWGMRPEGAWTVTRRAKEVVQEINIEWPCLSLAGCSTSDPFWEACGSDEISGGFLNRSVVLDAGLGADAKVRPQYHWNQLPAWLAEALGRIAGPRAQGGAKIQRSGAMAPKPIGWGDGAEDAWDAECQAIRKLPEGRRRDIFARAPEVGVRLATIAAVFRESGVVEIDDWTWGWGLASHSCGLVLKGANERMRVVREFDKICTHLLALLDDGPMKIGDIHARSRSAAGDRGMEIVDKALEDLMLSEEVVELDALDLHKLGIGGGPGKPTRWYARKGAGKGEGTR